MYDHDSEEEEEEEELELEKEEAERQGKARARHKPSKVPAAKTVEHLGAASLAERRHIGDSPLG